jgi:hypothetical protein
VIVLLESDGFHFWCSSEEVTRRLVEKGARVVVVAEQPENLGHLVDSAIPAEEPALEGPRG